MDWHPIQGGVQILPVNYYLNSKTLLDLCFALVYPFLTYCLIAWGNTYQTSLQPLLLLQKKAIRILTFSSSFEHTSPLFKDVNVIKLFDEVTVHIVYKFKNQLLPTNFAVFFTLIKETHNFNTRLSSRMTSALPKTRTNYGIFNIRYQGTKIWNTISDNIKLLSLKQFKKKLKIKHHCKLLTELTVQHVSFLPLVNLVTYFIFLLIFVKLYFYFKTSFCLCVCVLLYLLS